MAGAVSRRQGATRTADRARAGAGALSIAGKHALVTGGARGIGRAAAALLARRGAKVSIVSRSVTLSSPLVTLSLSKGDTAFAAQADVADEKQVRNAFAACREVNGPIAILVNSAGIAESAPLARTGLAMWERTLAINLTGTFLCTREALTDMADAGWGRIVNVASIAGLAGAPYISAYAASKHGVIGLTRSVAAELAGTNVTVNAVCPGYTETEMMHRAIANITARTQKSESEACELLAQSNPGGRIATAEEVALAILELIEGTETGAAIVIPRD